MLTPFLNNPMLERVHLEAIFPKCHENQTSIVSVNFPLAVGESQGKHTKHANRHFIRIGNKRQSDVNVGTFIHLSLVQEPASKQATGGGRINTQMSKTRPFFDPSTADETQLLYLLHNAEFFVRSPVCRE